MAKHVAHPSKFQEMSIINSIYMAILSLCTLIGLLFLPNFKNSHRVFLGYVAVTFIVEWIGAYNLYISQNRHIDFNIYYIYTVLNFILIIIYFSQIIHNKWIKIITMWIMPMVVVIMIGLIYWMGISVHKLFLINVFFFVLYAIVYLAQLLRSDGNILLNPHFWIVTGLLFFHAGFFFLSGFINYLSQKDIKLATQLYSINHVLNIIYYSLITYGFVCQRRLARL